MDATKNGQTPDERRDFLKKAGKVGLTGAAVTLLLASGDKPASACEACYKPKDEVPE